MSLTDEVRPFRRAHRDTTSPMIGGVSAGLARHLGWDPLWVRVAFIASTALYGAGVLLYAAFWLFLPAAPAPAPEAPGLESARRRGLRPRVRGRFTDLSALVVLGVVGLGVLLAVQAIFGGGASVLWPILVGGLGLAMLWRQADASQREEWQDRTGRLSLGRVVFGGGGWASYVRVFGGLALVLLSVLVFGVASGAGSAITQVTVAGLLALAGLTLVVGPWVRRLLEDLSAERAERVRTEERADMAAHLHDSVLQTLALIQKNAGDSGTVARLARGQERDLRAWLYSGERADDTSVASALRRMAAEIEDSRGVSVDVVAVGDIDMAEGWRAIVDAAREAVTNAARHAGVGQVDVYAELTPDLAEVFVRDRGVGFDTTAAPPEGRLGLRRSITDRMQRHGGTAVIRSAPGDGTEVRLSLPRRDIP